MKVKNLLILCFLSIFLPLCVQAQNLLVRGKVYDEKGLPKQGATVLVNGTNKGTTTNAEGKFEINASVNATLVISFIGYSNVSIPINGKSEIEVALELSSQDLKEIVVIGYGSQKKQDITSAIATVKVGDIANRPIVSAADAITGKSPGIQVLSGSGAPGGELSVRVRGVGSPNGGEPLYVVDGVITANLKAINPNTIESINV